MQRGKWRLQGCARVRHAAELRGGPVCMRVPCWRLPIPQCSGSSPVSHISLSFRTVKLLTCSHSCWIQLLKSADWLFQHCYSDQHVNISKPLSAKLIPCTLITHGQLTAVESFLHRNHRLSISRSGMCVSAGGGHSHSRHRAHGRFLPCQYLASPTRDQILPAFTCNEGACNIAEVVKKQKKVPSTCAGGR